MKLLNWIKEKSWPFGSQWSWSWGYQYEEQKLEELEELEELETPVLIFTKEQEEASKSFAERLAEVIKKMTPEQKKKLAEFIEKLKLNKN
jgi:hypothetical protein